MKKSWIVMCAFLGFIVVSSSIYANIDQNAAEHVIRRAYTSIDRVEEGRIFLKPEKLCLRKGIIYVEDINGKEFAIPAVFSSIGHPYMQVSESIIFNSWKCECGALNHKWDHPTHCWSCGRPR